LDSAETITIISTLLRETSTIRVTSEIGNHTIEVKKDDGLVTTSVRVWAPEEQDCAAGLVLLSLGNINLIII
jgi:hypothetical protein